MKVRMSFCLCIAFCTCFIASVNQVSAGGTTLLEEIQQKAPTYEIAPQNAKIDPVWKALPGYNGRKVNIQASFEKMKKTGKFDEKQLVFEQISPAIHLRDLPPLPVFKGNENKKMVAFTINVAWGNEYLPTILQTLKKNDAQATFFLEGRWVKNYPHLAKMIVESGQEVGNHSYTHPNMANLSRSGVLDQLTKTNEVIRAITTKEVQWFAPPSGSYNMDVAKETKSMGMETIMWSADTIDWKNPSREVFINRIMKKLEPGIIVLMHPKEVTATYLEDLIKHVKEKGYKVVNISTLLDEKRE